jgi:hypothetical protein
LTGYSIKPKPRQEEKREEGRKGGRVEYMKGSSCDPVPLEGDMMGSPALLT